MDLAKIFKKTKEYTCLSEQAYQMYNHAISTSDDLADMLVIMRSIAWDDSVLRRRRTTLRSNFGRYRALPTGRIFI